MSNNNNEEKYLTLHPLAYLIYDKYTDLFKILKREQPSDVNEFKAVLELYILNTQDITKEFDAYVKEWHGNYLSLGFRNFDKDVLKTRNKGFPDYLEKVNNKKCIELSSLLVESGFVIKDKSSITITDTMETIEGYLHMANEDIDLSIDNFSTILTKITQSDVDYMNEIIKITCEATLDIDSLQKIKYLAYSIETLDKRGITSTKYEKKALEPYLNVRNKAKNFGIFLSEIPVFPNPTNLLKEVDSILADIGLNAESKKDVFQEIFTRKLLKQNNMLEARSLIQYRNWQELSLKEQTAIHSLVMYDKPFDVVLSKKAHDFINGLSDLELYHFMIEITGTNINTAKILEESHLAKIQVIKEKRQKIECLLSDILNNKSKIASLFNLQDKDLF